MATRSDSTIKELIKKIKFSVRNSLIFYGPVLNRSSRKERKLFKLSFDSHFSNLSQKIIENLRADGIAFSHVDELFPESDYSHTFLNWIQKHKHQLVEKEKKNFLYSYFGSKSNEVLVESDNPFFEFYLSDKILYICSEYLGYLPQLNLLAVEKTIPTEDLNSPQHSQKWHRDPEEKRTIKVFIYVNDVDETKGPFTYIKGSQPSGNSPYARIFPQALPHGSYPDAARIVTLVDPEDYVAAIGKAGTVIFCDTAGIHRGGLAKSGERIMSTAFYPSKKWSERPRVKKSPDVNLHNYGTMAPNVILSD